MSKSINVKEQGWPSPEGMKCPNNQFYYVKFLTCRILISWGHSLSPMETLIFYLSFTMYQDGWRLKPPKLMMLEFGMPRALISDQGSHFYKHAMAILLKKYRVVHRVATAYHP
ncbi:hypothetical protein CR513_46022, partial [Mucuna pruriens]